MKKQFLFFILFLIVLFALLISSNDANSNYELYERDEPYRSALIDFPIFSGWDRLYVWYPDTEPEETNYDPNGQCELTQFCHDGFLIGTRTFGFIPERYHTFNVRYHLYDESLDILDLIEAITIKNNNLGFAAAVEEFINCYHTVVAKIWLSGHDFHYWFIARNPNDRYVLLLVPEYHGENFNFLIDDSDCD